MFNLSDIHWLTSDAAEPWLADAALEKNLVGLAKRLRKHLSSEQTHLVLEQTQLRHRAREKFSHAAHMFFTRKGFEQSTDETIARYKSQRFALHSKVADLCCGIGGDTLGIAQIANVTAVDRCDATAFFAKTNCERLGLHNVEVQAQDIRELDLSKFQAIHVDPDRRVLGKRTSQVQGGEPGLKTLCSLVERYQNVAIKLSPTAVLPIDMERRGELEWIESRGECRQLVAWFGNLAYRPGSRQATMVVGDKIESFGVSEPTTPTLGQSPVIGKYLYEPRPSILAADLTSSIANAHELNAIAPGIPYLVSNQRIDHPMLRGWMIHTWLPFDLRRLRAKLQDANFMVLDVKKRGVDLSPRTIARKLHGTGEKPITLIVTRHENRVIALITSRVTT
ncbi:MAG: class I SAM-dependent methyltransferase [Pirellulaceae bacterium]|nr:class I SAM-dependent methyltransferase [Pirellulaceae bacterium]